MAQNERLFMSREDWDEWDSKRWARFDRMYYGEPWHATRSGGETEQPTGNRNGAREETIWD
jgi:hypothetical protein